MKVNKWTNGLAAAGVVSLASVAQAGEANETVMTAVSSTTLSGYVSTSAIWKPGTGNAGNPGRIFQDGAGEDGFNIDAISLSISKPLDEGEWSAGYNTQLWLGDNTFGFGNTIGGDVAIKNANVDLRIPVGNGLDLKMGVFDTIIGYESTDTPNNPNYSIGYGWQISPTQHTGALLSYNIGDIVDVTAGIANSYAPSLGFAGPRANRGVFGPAADESEKTYMAAIAITAPDSAGFLAGSSLYAGVVDGLGTGFSNTFDTTNIYVGATLNTPVEGLTAGASWDYRFNGPNGVTPGANWAQSVAGYLSYAATEKLSVSYRLNWAKGSAGTFYVRPAGDDEAQNKLLSNTLTIGYALWENVITRVEARWDHALDSNKIYGNAPDGEVNSLTFAFNVVYQF